MLPGAWPMAMLFSAQSQTISLPSVCHRAITGMTMTLEREKFTFQSANWAGLEKVFKAVVSIQFLIGKTTSAKFMDSTFWQISFI